VRAVQLRLDLADAVCAEIRLRGGGCGPREGEDRDERAHQSTAPAAPANDRTARWIAISNSTAGHRSGLGTHGRLPQRRAVREAHLHSAIDTCTDNSSVQPATETDVRRHFPRTNLWLSLGRAETTSTGEKCQDNFVGNSKKIYVGGGKSFDAESFVCATGESLHTHGCAS